MKGIQMNDQTSNERNKAAMRERNSLNLNISGKEGVKVCSMPQVRKEDVTTTTNPPGKHPYDRK
jgi:hypothetical protein